MKHEGKQGKQAKRLLALAFVTVIAGSVRADPGVARADHAARAAELTLGLDLDEARKEIAAAGDADDPAIALERGRLALYEADCDAAALVLARPELAKTDEGAALGDVARGCARVIAATVVDKDDARAVEVRYQDEGDRALTPVLVDTVVKARDALTRDLGVSWPKPTRIVVVRDLLSLSAMTGLPYESAQTTGTVAVAKWGRVTLLSPRASHHGYAWRDTMTHELTHLAVTRATIDRAPLWLQEGVAKRQEIRWRDPGPFDDRPPVDAVVARGMELQLDVGLDKLGPSIAMLPSADAAMVAFAEVTSFVRFFAQTSPPDALPKLLSGLRNHKSVDEALKDAGGADMKQWDAKWRAYLAQRPKEPLPASFGLGSEPAGVRDLRERVRLAELLYGRNHPAEALRELDRVARPATPTAGSAPSAPASPDDPSLRYVRAKALEAAGRTKEAEPLVADPAEVIASYGPWWALRGRFAIVRNELVVADGSFFESVAADPFDIESACRGGADPAVVPEEGGLRLLCDAARAAGEPGLGQD